MSDNDNQKIFTGIIIGLVIFALFAWASGVGEPKYDSKAEYDAAVGAGLEPPEGLYDDRLEYDDTMGRP